jgi:SPRY domain
LGFPNATVSQLHGQIFKIKIQKNFLKKTIINVIRQSKFCPETSEQYGTQCSNGDCVGVLLDFQNEVGTLSFFKNGHYMGEAHTGLTGTFYPAVTFFANGSTITLDHSPVPSFTK